MSQIHMASNIPIDPSLSYSFFSSLVALAPAILAVALAAAKVGRIHRHPLAVSLPGRRVTRAAQPGTTTAVLGQPAPSTSLASGARLPAPAGLAAPRALAEPALAPRLEWAQVEARVLRFPERRDGGHGDAVEGQETEHGAELHRGKRVVGGNVLVVEVVVYKSFGVPTMVRLLRAKRRL